MTETKRQQLLDEAYELIRLMEGLTYQRLSHEELQRVARWEREAMELGPNGDGLTFGQASHARLRAKKSVQQDLWSA